MKHIKHNLSKAIMLSLGIGMFASGAALAHH